jgi:hypothetical protein
MFVETKSTLLSGITITPGTMYFLTDTDSYAFDSSGSRRIFTDSVLYMTKANILALTAPIKNKIYIATDTGSVYKTNTAGNGVDVVVDKEAVPKVTRGSLTVDSDKTSVELPTALATGFDITKDELLVFTNTIFLFEGIDYSVSESSGKITLTKIGTGDDSNWYAYSGEKRFFYFIVLKNLK